MMVKFAILKKFLEYKRTLAPKCKLSISQNHSSNGLLDSMTVDHKTLTSAKLTHLLLNYENAEIHFSDPDRSNISM